MKTSDRIAIAQVVNGISVGGWNAHEHITVPRKSCADALRIRNQLRRMVYAKAETINGWRVYREDRPHTEARYRVDNRVLTFAEALAVVSEPAPPPVVVQLRLPLGEVA